MADTKLTGLTADTAPGLDSLLYMVDDPAGTPASRKATVGDLLITNGLLHGAAEISVTGATTATIGKMHVCSGTTANYTLTLPAASGNAGKILGVRMSPALTKLVTLDGNASEAIDGATTRIMWAEESAILLCDGSNWFKIAGKSVPMRARLSRATDESTINAATWTRCTMTAQEYGTTHLWDSGNGRITIPRPGACNVSVFGYMSKVTGTMVFGYLGIAKNAVSPGTGYGYQQSAAVAQSAAGSHSIQALDVAVGDYLNLCGYTDATTAKWLGAAVCGIFVVEVSVW